MGINLSDEELVQEFKKRFGKKTESTTEKHELMEQLTHVNNKLVESENMKSNFLSNIRNEINNPIASVLELSKNISEGNFSQEQVVKFSNLIHSEIFNLDFQLRNIFHSAEIEAGETTLSVASVNISAMIQNILKAFNHQVEKKKITVFVTNKTSGNSHFFTDSEKLHLIISNMLSNAIQFSHEKGRITIEFAIEPGLFKFSISDTGCGMSETNKALIFDRFRQGQEGSTKNFGGHGLGMSVSKALLEIINGNIALTSKIDEGSTFSIAVIESPQNDFDTIESNDGNDFLFFNNDESLKF